MGNLLGKNNRKIVPIYNSNFLNNSNKSKNNLNKSNKTIPESKCKYKKLKVKLDNYTNI